MSSAFPQIKFDPFPLGGGLDLVSPGLSIKPGRLVAGVNVEPWIAGGYRRIYGFERVDGRAAPSAATLYTMTVANGASIAPNSTITGGTTGSGVRVVAKDGNTLGVTALTGAGLSVGEAFGATTVASTPTVVIAVDEATRELWQLAAENYYRGLIGAVPGSGPVRGVWQRGSARYAWRDNGAACKLYKSTTGGWIEVATNTVILKFKSGTGSTFNEGDAINKGAGDIAIVHRVVVWSGNWGTNDAKGYLVLKTVTGAFADNDPIKVGATTHATANGASYAYSQASGGKYRHIQHNFFGGSGTERIYGVDGVNPAFEIDENNVFSPILLDTTLTNAPALNAPFLICDHQEHLFLAFKGGSVQHSVPGEPLVFNGFLGSAEFGLGAECTGLKSITGGVLVMATRKNTQALYGADTATWEKKIAAPKAGAVIDTLDSMADSYMLDAAGVVSLARVQEFGNFQNAAVSAAVQPLAIAGQDTAIGTLLISPTNQYRLVYSSGRCLAMYVRADGAVEFTEIDYGISLFCCAYARNELEQDAILLGGTDGYVYQAEKGNSFDGNPIEMIMRLPYIHSGSAPIRKRYKRGEIEISASSSVTLSITTDLNYSSGETDEYTSAVDVPPRGGRFDVDNWDEIFYDGQGQSRPTFDLHGSGPNTTVSLYHSSATTPPFIMQSMILHYLPGRVQRGAFQL